MRAAKELQVTTRISTAGMKNKKSRLVNGLVLDNRVPQACSNDIGSDDKYQWQDNIDNEKKYKYFVWSKQNAISTLNGPITRLF